MLIVIEGGDAAGKMTQSTRLAECLKGQRFAFPNYDSPTGRLILGHLKKDWACRAVAGEPIEGDNLVFQCLQTVNRLEVVSRIKKALDAGPVVCDRYWQSAVIYGTLDGLDSDWLSAVQRDPMPEADINILIDLPIEEGFKRRPERRDRYEVNREFMERVRAEYLRLWAPNAPVGYFDANETFESFNSGKKWFVVNGRYPAERVHEIIFEIVNRSSATSSICPGLSRECACQGATNYHCRTHGSCDCEY